MKLFAAALVLSAALPIAAQDAPPKGFTSIELLYPSGAPGALGTKESDIPRLYCYPASGNGPHTAVVVLPGGGYNHVVLEKEGGMEARWLNERGISAYVLQYRFSPGYHYPVPLDDGSRAIRLVRSHAKDWNLRADAIGIWGFSAGGHMAGYLATAADKPNPTVKDPIDRISGHPDFAIFSYARLSLTPDIPGIFTMKTLLGDNAPQELLDAASPVRHVTPNTSPSFLYATSADQTVSALNATVFYNALQLAHVPAELHVFEQGQHGTHMGTDQPTHPELAVFPTLLENWLRLHKWLAAPAVAKAYIIGEFTITDAEAYKAYIAKVTPMVAQFGGKYIVRGGTTVPVEGAPPAGRIVVLEFESLAAARTFEDSPEYRAIAPLRQKASHGRVFLVEGALP